MDKNKYDEIPVVYCKNCRSLSIVEEMGLDFCKSCGSINYTGEDLIENIIDD